MEFRLQGLGLLAGFLLGFCSGHSKGSGVLALSIAGV